MKKLGKLDSSDIEFRLDGDGDVWLWFGPEQAHIVGSLDFPEDIEELATVAAKVAKQVREMRKAKDE